MERPTLTERFAREVRAEKGRRHLTNVDIAAATGIPESRLSRKLRMVDPDEFTLREVQAIADYLDIEVAELLVRSRCFARDTAFFRLRDGTKQPLDTLLAA